MKGPFHKSISKKLIPLILLICLLSESIFIPDIPTVYAASTDYDSVESVNDEITTNSTEDEDSSINVDILEQTNSIVTESSANSDSNTTGDTSSSFDDSNAADTNSVTQDSASDSTQSNDEEDNSGDTTKEEQLELSKEHFPDDIFRNYIAEHFDTDGNNQLSAEEITKIESVDISNMGISDLTGIEYFTNILYLYCNGNMLKALNVDALVNMTVLDCSYNYLTNLDLSNCFSLISLECQNNAAAIILDEDYTFDLSSLKDFDINNSSDWSENITITDNNLTLLTDSVSSLINYRYYVSAPLIEDTYLDFTLVTTTIPQTDVVINEDNFPDLTLRDYIKDNFDQDENSILSADELNTITYLYIPAQNIASLTGIEYLANLVYLNFDDNNVSAIDLNSLMNLKGIYCDNNKLEQLICDKLIHLTNLYCSNNQLYSIDLSECVSIEDLECKDNLYEITANNNCVDLSTLSLLDPTRTSEWSTGNLTSDNNLILNDTTQAQNVTYTYSVEAPNEAFNQITFTLNILPDTTKEADETSDIQPQSAPIVQTQPEQSVTTASVPATSQSPAITSYTVTFNSDGGSTIATQSVLAQNKVSMPANPVKSGYLFGGWYYGNTTYDFNTQLTSNITLTAHWNKVSPAKPSIKSLKNSKKSKMKITVKSVKNIAGYEVSYSTNKNAKKNAIIVNTTKTSFTVSNLVKGKTYYVRARTYSYDSTGKKVYSSYSKIKKVTIKKGLIEAKATSTSATIKSSKITSKNNVRIEAKTKNMIKSSDNYYYLFSLPSYKKSISKTATPLDKTLKSTSFQLNTTLNLDSSKSQLYSKFVVAIKVKSGYQIISKAKYITNPQKVANFTYSFPTAATKKGLQINASMLNDVKDLGVKNSAFNIPLNLIIAAPGETNYRSSVDYEYNGETYWFRKSMIAAYDSLFRNLENQDIVVTAIVLLGWRDDLTYLITPSGREKGHSYYNFNTSSKKARKQLEATFTFLAERYASGDQNGKVVNWVIGNEINSFDAWNYAGTKSLSKYTQLYADSYRLAYTALKSVYSNARLYVSLDQCWTTSNSVTFGGKEFLQKFNSILKESGNISWNLAYHAYPSPLTDPRFWKNANGLSQNNENSPIISISNISVLTKYIKKHYGKSTRIILSEQGFTSASPYGEKTQAAAMAYAYYLVEFNSMIDSFILSRHVDNIAETRDRLNLGLWTNTPGQVEQAYKKKYAWKVYKYMDTPSSTNVTKFALKIIGTSSWKKIIPNYKAKKFKSMPSAN